MIIREHALPITKQAEALNISRGSVYWRFLNSKLDFRG
jgi:hypothetical protein